MNDKVQTPSGAAGSAPHAVPPVDGFEDENGITLVADLPGVSRERLAVRVDGDQLLLEGTAQADVPKGLELLHGEARLPVYRRVVALTGWGQQQDKDAAAQAGFDQHWTKPVDPARLNALDSLRAPRPVRRS